MAERIDSGIRQATGDKVEGQVEVGEREKCEELLDQLVESLDVEKYLARNRVICCEELTALDQGIDGSEEGSVEPSSTLRYELRNSIWQLLALHFRTDHQ